MELFGLRKGKEMAFLCYIQYVVLPRILLGSNASNEKKLMEKQYYKY